MVDLSLVQCNPTLITVKEFYTGGIEIACPERLTIGDHTVLNAPTTDTCWRVGYNREILSYSEKCSYYVGGSQLEINL